MLGGRGEGGPRSSENSVFSRGAPILATRVLMAIGSGFESSCVTWGRTLHLWGPVSSPSRDNCIHPIGPLGRFQ